MKVNQQHIANLLNVSRVTVTKALQDHADIAPSTRQKVQALAQQLGYIPNGIGRSLSTQKTNILGIIIPKINHSFFSSVTEHMYSAAARLGYQIVLSVTFEDAQQEFNNIKTLLSMNVDGILIDTAASTVGPAAFDLISKRKVPLLFFDRKLRDYASPGIYFEDYRLSFQLATELIHRGFTDIMYITGSQQISINHERLRGFREGTQSLQHDIPDHRIIEASLQESDGYQAFRRFIATAEALPEIVVCVNDSVALGVYQACQEANISIPAQLSVVGFGNVLVSALTHPPLSTVALMIEEASVKAIENLVYLVEHESSDLLPDAFFSGQIIFRESVGTPKESKKDNQ